MNNRKNRAFENLPLGTGTTSQAVVGSTLHNVYSNLPQGPWPGCWAHRQTAEVDTPSSSHSGIWKANKQTHKSSLWWSIATLNTDLHAFVYPLSYTLRYLWTSLGRYSLSKTKWSLTMLSVSLERQWETGWSDVEADSLPAARRPSWPFFCWASSFWPCVISQRRINSQPPHLKP